MQNPNEDTQWNDVLRSKGILPPKQTEAAITEDALVQVGVAAGVRGVASNQPRPHPF